MSRSGTAFVASHFARAEDVELQSKSQQPLARYFAEVAGASSYLTNRDILTAQAGVDPAPCAKLLLFMSASSSPEPSQRAPIFLVEDHPDTLKYLTMFLGPLGHTVQSARTIREALSKISNTNCDILICDIGLPDGNGHELLRQMKVTRQIYAIAISGFGSESDIAKSKAAGFRHHITKPFRGDDLIPFLDEATRELAA